MNARKTVFYQTQSGKCPVEDHLDSLSDEQAARITWVLKLIRELDRVPVNYFKKLVSTNDIWEVRVSSGNSTFRLLGFLDSLNQIILTNSFQKKSRKTSAKEIRLAEKRRKEYLNRRQASGRP